MGDVILFPFDRRQRPYVEYLRAYRDGVFALLGKLLAAVDDCCPALGSSMDEATRMSLVAARDYLSAMDLESAVFAGAGPEQLNHSTVGLLLVGRQAVELARGVTELVAHVSVGRAATL